MLSKTIKYKDYRGVERKEEFLFNLTKAEVAEMELSYNGGMSEHIKRIVSTENSPEIIKLFKNLITRSHGRISEDGRRFVKSEEMRQEFLQTEAYSELFMELASDADAAAAFVEGIIPEIENKPVKAN